MREPIWIELEDVLAYHDESLKEHGGAEGIRDLSGLESALARPKNLLAYTESAPSLHQLAAAYAFGMARSHPFVDGNKRTAFVVAFTFLALHGIEITAAKEDRYTTFLSLAEGTLTESQVAAWFKQNSRRAPKPRGSGRSR